MRHSRVKIIVNERQDVPVMTTLVGFIRQEATRMTEIIITGHTVTLHGITSLAKRTLIRNNARKRKKLIKRMQLAKEPHDQKRMTHRWVTRSSMDPL